MNTIIGRRQQKVVINESSPLVVVAPFGKSSKKDFTDYIQHAIKLETFGADMVQELSTYGPFKRPRKEIIDEIQIPYGTVLTYEFLSRCNAENNLTQHKIESILKDTLISHIESGVDYITIHASLSSRFMNTYNKHINRRIIPIPSRSGSMLLRLMKKHKIDNPLHTFFNYISKTCAQNNVSISLGSTFRAGAIKDSMDYVQIQEVYEQRKLFGIAKESELKNMLLEGFGHGLPHEFEEYCQLVKSHLSGIPITALGPLPVDTAIGLDDIAATVGISFGRMHGLSLVNIITAKEHLAIPTLADVAKAIRHAKLGGFIGDAIKTGKNSFIDSQMSIARNKLLWDEQKEHALFPDLFAEIYDSLKYENGESCNICEKNCPHKFLIK